MQHSGAEVTFFLGKHFENALQERVRGFDRHFEEVYQLKKKASIILLFPCLTSEVEIRPFLSVSSVNCEF